MDHFSTNQKYAGRIKRPEQENYKGSQGAIDRSEFQHNPDIQGKDMLCNLKERRRKERTDKGMRYFDLGFRKKDIYNCNSKKDH